MCIHVAIGSFPIGMQCKQHDSHTQYCNMIRVICAALPLCHGRWSQASIIHLSLCSRHRQAIVGTYVCISFCTSLSSFFIAFLSLPTLLPLQATVAAFAASEGQGHPRIVDIEKVCLCDNLNIHSTIMFSGRVLIKRIDMREHLCSCLSHVF